MQLRGHQLPPPPSSLQVRGQFDPVTCPSLSALGVELLTYLPAWPKADNISYLGRGSPGASIKIILFLSGGGVSASPRGADRLLLVLFWGSCVVPGIDLGLTPARQSVTLPLDSLWPWSYFSVQTLSHSFQSASI